jgi:flagellar M-ring protein FliF
MRFLAIAGVCVAVLIAAVVLLSRTDWEILYQGMNDVDTGQVVQQLIDAGERYRFGSDPGTVEVPEGNASRLRSQLAFQGRIPQTGFAYDIYAMGRGFGATESDRRQYAIYQLAEKIRDDIVQQPLIRDARVNLSIPESRPALFQSEVISATAAVILTLHGDVRLTGAQVRGIEELVAASVEGLTVDNVQITDQNFVLLRGEDDEPTEYDIHLRREQLRKAFVDDIRSALYRLTFLAFGPENVSVEVNARLNWRTEHIEAIEFSPVVGDEDGIAVAISSLRESATAMNQQAMIEGSDPNGGAPFYPEYDPTTGTYQRNVYEANFEVNQTLHRINEEQGDIAGVSVMLTVNDIFEDERLEAQLQNALSFFLGVYPFEPSVYTSFMPFPALTERDEMYAHTLSVQERERLFNLITTLVPIVLIFIALLIIVLQTFGLLRYKPELPEVQDLLTPEQLELIGLAIDGTPLPEGEMEPVETDEERLRMGQIRIRLEEIINKNPELAAELLRNWLNADDPYG